ncbi:hypothetical protein BC936DRAFT_138210, partial [Jimgerdemannia flammicorona]
MVTKFGDIVIIRRNGDESGRFPITKSECTFGRQEDNDIRLHLPHISKLHCKITVDEEGKAWVENYSDNGTKVNDAWLHADKQALNEGDVITLCNRNFRFEYPKDTAKNISVGSPARAPLKTSSVPNNTTGKVPAKSPVKPTSTPKKASGNTPKENAANTNQTKNPETCDSANVSSEAPAPDATPKTPLPDKEGYEELVTPIIPTSLDAAVEASALPQSNSRKHRLSSDSRLSVIVNEFSPRRKVVVLDVSPKLNLASTPEIEQHSASVQESTVEKEEPLFSDDVSVARPATPAEPMAGRTVAFFNLVAEGQTPPEHNSFDGEGGSPQSPFFSPYSETTINTFMNISLPVTDSPLADHVAPPPKTPKSNKKVSFGPPLSPELFDLSRPSATPIKKGRQPFESPQANRIGVFDFSVRTDTPGTKELLLRTPLSRVQEGMGSPLMVRKLMKTPFPIAEESDEQEMEDVEGEGGVDYKEEFYEESNSDSDDIEFGQADCDIRSQQDDASFWIVSKQTPVASVLDGESDSSDEEDAEAENVPPEAKEKAVPETEQYDLEVQQIIAKCDTPVRENTDASEAQKTQPAPVTEGHRLATPFRNQIEARAKQMQGSRIPAPGELRKGMATPLKRELKAKAVAIQETRPASVTEAAKKLLKTPLKKDIMAVAAKIQQSRAPAISTIANRPIKTPMRRAIIAKAAEISEQKAKTAVDQTKTLPTPLKNDIKVKAKQVDEMRPVIPVTSLSTPFKRELKSKAKEVEEMRPVIPVTSLSTPFKRELKSKAKEVEEARAALPVASVSTPFRKELQAKVREVQEARPPAIPVASLSTSFKKELKTKAKEIEEAHPSVPVASVSTPFRKELQARAKQLEEERAPGIPESVAGALNTPFRKEIRARASQLAADRAKTALENAHTLATPVKSEIREAAERMREGRQTAAEFMKRLATPMKKEIEQGVVLNRRASFQMEVGRRFSIGVEGVENGEDDVEVTERNGDEETSLGSTGAIQPKSDEPSEAAQEQEEELKYETHSLTSSPRKPTTAAGLLASISAFSRRLSTGAARRLSEVLPTWSAASAEEVEPEVEDHDHENIDGEESGDLVMDETVEEQKREEDVEQDQQLTDENDVIPARTPERVWFSGRKSEILPSRNEESAELGSLSLAHQTIGGVQPSPSSLQSLMRLSIGGAARRVLLRMDDAAGDEVLQDAKEQDDHSIVPAAEDTADHDVDVESEVSYGVGVMEDTVAEDEPEERTVEPVGAEHVQQEDVVEHVPESIEAVVEQTVIEQTQTSEKELESKGKSRRGTKAISKAKRGQKGAKKEMGIVDERMIPEEVVETRTVNVEELSLAPVQEPQPKRGGPAKTAKKPAKEEQKETTANSVEEDHMKNLTQSQEPLAETPHVENVAETKARKTGRAKGSKAVQEEAAAASDQIVMETIIVETQQEEQSMAQAMDFEEPKVKNNGNGKRGKRKAKEEIVVEVPVVAETIFVEVIEQQENVDSEEKTRKNGRGKRGKKTAQEEAKVGELVEELVEEPVLQETEIASVTLELEMQQQEEPKKSGRGNRSKETIPSKPSGKGRRGKNTAKEDEETIEPVQNIQLEEEKVEKIIPLTQDLTPASSENARREPVEPTTPQIDGVESKVDDKASSSKGPKRGRRVKTDKTTVVVTQEAVEEHHIKPTVTEELNPTENRSRAANKKNVANVERPVIEAIVEEVTNTDDANAIAQLVPETDTPIVQKSGRGRRGKKMEKEETVAPTNDPGIEIEPELVELSVKKGAAKGGAGKSKRVLDESEPVVYVDAPEPSEKRKGGRAKTEADDVEDVASCNQDEQVEAETEAKQVVKRGRGAAAKGTKRDALTTVEVTETDNGSGVATSSRKRKAVEVVEEQVDVAE